MATKTKFSDVAQNAVNAIQDKLSEVVKAHVKAAKNDGSLRRASLILLIEAIQNGDEAHAEEIAALTAARALEGIAAQLRKAHGLKDDVPARKVPGYTGRSAIFSRCKAVLAKAAPEQIAEVIAGKMDLDKLYAEVSGGGGGGGKSLSKATAADIVAEVTRREGEAFSIFTMLGNAILGNLVPWENAVPTLAEWIERAGPSAVKHYGPRMRQEAERRAPREVNAEPAALLPAEVQ